MQILVAAIEKRCQKRNLTADLERIRYSNKCLYHDISSSGKVLYVGLGHGLDALLALIDGLAIEITGVDPYIDDHGNDQQDYNELIKLTKEFSIGDKLLIEKTSIQEFINNTSDKFDAVICSDVLHHIFWTSDLLQKSDLFSSAVELFNSINKVVISNGVLVISEPERYGMRQFLSNLNILNTAVNYRTKQPSGQWISLAEMSGWKIYRNKNYIPWALRKYKYLFSGIPGRFTACDHYFLYFRK